MIHQDIYVVTPQALKDAAQRGVTGEIANRLSRMAKRSAPHTCELGNRRFEDYILGVTKDGVIESVRLISELH